MRVLILGGTSEARTLAARVAELPDIGAVLSLAGRTREPQAQPIAMRIGGFGGIDGLCTYLKREGIERVIDATHPFAEQMSRHAAAACARLGIPLLTLTREPWQRQIGDKWSEVADLDSAVRALGDAPRRVFLTIGRLGLAAFARAPQHFYLVRTIDPPADLPALPNHQLILARGPFAVEDEERLMRNAAIDVLVSKNSGGAATYAKMMAARHLGLRTIVIAPPSRPDVPVVHDIDAALRFLAHETLRGV
ncbi:MAG TPA: cobalt-precorrin-6A reductase [Beijerinckiaceae bacterium]|jgi:precorrin-6A/cobalt-precorrin-6A reductase|nr:cobalt-precorrin-6A reductase [Beijerinckiaceae bacterium]